MKFEVSNDFEKALKHLKKKYPSLVSDVLAFKEELTMNPLLGIELFPNCRKARLAIKSKGKGKSGGGRIIFYFKVVEDSILLLYLYDKAEMDSVSEAFIKELLKTS